MKSPMPPCASKEDYSVVTVLPDLIFSSKIDYITLDGVCKPEPEGLVGRCVWPRQFQGRRMTIHDPCASDIVALYSSYPNACVAEAEIAVDVRPRRPTDESMNLDHLRLIKEDILAKRLMPMFAPGLNSGFRGGYKKHSQGFSLTPFNRRVPSLDEQLLYGRREDPAQVKVYHKVSDNKRPIHWRHHVIRVEVRLGATGLRHHGVEKVSDLVGFAFRKQLSPYFRLASSTTRACFRRRTPVAPLMQLLNNYQHDEDQKHWSVNGIGPFLRGGKRETSGAKFLRDQELNDRIGQALHRLQRQYSEVKFVCLRQAANDSNPVSMRA